MSAVEVSLTDLRQHLAHLINRASYSGDRIVLVSHGEPKAAIIGIDELRRLEQARIGSGSSVQMQIALEAADRLRESLNSWQHGHEISVEQVEDTLAQLRAELDDDTARLC